MKSKLISAAMYLVIGFMVALIVDIVFGLVIHREGGLIDWITVLMITVVLMILNCRTIGRTAAKIQSDGVRAALRALFVEEKKK